MDSQEEQELYSRLAEAETRLEEVREAVRVSGLPMTPTQRNQLDEAKLHVRAVKAECDAALTNGTEAALAN